MVIHSKVVSHSVNSGSPRFPIDFAERGAKTYTAWDTSPWRPVPRHPSAKTNCLFFDSHVTGIETADLVDDLYGEPDCMYDNE